MKSESVSASVIFTLPRFWSSVISPFSITKRSLSSSVQTSFHQVSVPPVWSTR